MDEPGAAAAGEAPAAPEDADSVAAAEAAAVRILRGASQSAASLQRRLQRRGFSQEAAAAATAAMVERRYVDDAALAHSLAQRRQRSGHGRLHVVAELRARGIDDEAVNATVAGVDPQAERDSALALGRRLSARAGSTATPVGRSRRVAGQLQRRGFDGETVRWVLRELERGS